MLIPCVIHVSSLGDLHKWKHTVRILLLFLFYFVLKQARICIDIVNLFYLCSILHCTNAIIYLPVHLLLDLLDVSRVVVVVVVVFNVIQETMVLTTFKPIHFSNYRDHDGCILKQLLTFMPPTSSPSSHSDWVPMLHMHIFGLSNFVKLANRNISLWL